MRKAMLSLWSLLVLLSGVMFGQRYIWHFFLESPVLSENLSFSDDYIDIIFSVDETDVGFNIRNKTDRGIKIIWDDISMINPDGNSSRIIHNGIRLMDRNIPQATTMIPPKSNVLDMLVPSENIYYLTNGEWGTNPLFAGADRLIWDGKEFSIYFPLEINGDRKEYIFKFKMGVSLPAPIPEKKTKLRINVGGANYTCLGYNFSYDFISYNNEKGNFKESLNDVSGFGFYSGIGYLIFPNVEITADYFYGSGDTEGNYSITIPNPKKTNMIATNSSSEKSNYKLSNWCVGANFHLYLFKSNASLYLGVGINGSTYKVDMMKQIYYSQTYSNSINRIEITSIDLKNITINKLGIAVRGGGRYKIVRNVGLFLEGRYIPASENVSELLLKDVGIEKIIKLDFGGFKGIAGIQIMF